MMLQLDMPVNRVRLLSSWPQPTGVVGLQSGLGEHMYAGLLATIDKPALHNAFLQWKSQSAGASWQAIVGSFAVGYKLQLSDVVLKPAEQLSFKKDKINLSRCLWGAALEQQLPLSEQLQLKTTGWFSQQQSIGTKRMPSRQETVWGVHAGFIWNNGYQFGTLFQSSNINNTTLHFFARSMLTNHTQLAAEYSQIPDKSDTWALHLSLDKPSLTPWLVWHATANYMIPWHDKLPVLTIRNNIHASYNVLPTLQLQTGFKNTQQAHMNRWLIFANASLKPKKNNICKTLRGQIDAQTTTAHTEQRLRVNLHVDNNVTDKLTASTSIDWSMTKKITTWQVLTNMTYALSSQIQLHSMLSFKPWSAILHIMLDAVF